MTDARDNWGRAEVVIQAVSALGSIAIPIALLLVGNSFTDRQRKDSDRQLEADRVERMLAHLVSEKADEKKLTMRVVQFWSAQGEFPSELLPALGELASSDSREDVAATASAVLSKVAESAQTGVAAEARNELSSLPVRLNVHDATNANNPKLAQATSDLAHTNVIISRQQTAASAAPPPKTELRYFRPEDAAQAKTMQTELAQRGITSELKDLSGSVAQKSVRPKSFDLVVGAQ